jgi:hypothetical protein
MPDSFAGLALVALLFGLLAGACAFVISYGSYQNQFMDTRMPRRLALQTAGVTFLFFFAATVALPLIFSALRHMG